MYLQVKLQPIYCFVAGSSLHRKWPWVAFTSNPETAACEDGTWQFKQLAEEL